MQTICPDVLSMVGETSLWIRMGFIESDKVVIIFTYLFIYLFASELKSLLLSS
jgi:hypothetical protein